MRKTSQIASIKQPEPNQVYLGHCLKVLRSWPDNFVDCVVTSPPYWGLRSYNTKPQIWDADPACKHRWGTTIKHPKFDKRTREEKIKNGANVGNNLSTEKHSPMDSGRFCKKCTAWKGELGLEPDFRAYIRHLIQIFTEVYRVLKPTGTCFVNMGDSYVASGGNYDGDGSTGTTTTMHYKAGNKRMPDTGRVARTKIAKSAGLKPKSLMNIPYRFAIAMTDEVGFIQRNELIWWKRDAQPSSATDRWTVDFEPIFFFTKTGKYYFEQQLELAESKPGKRKTNVDTSAHNVSVPYARAGNPYGSKRNARTVLDISTEKTDLEHYASYPTRLVELPITAGCPYSICDECGKAKYLVYPKITHSESGSGKSGNPILGKTQIDNSQIRENNDIRLGPVTDYGTPTEHVCECKRGFVPGIVLDPFAGTGTTQVVAVRLGRWFLGIELQEDYHKDLTERLAPEIEKKSRSLF